MTLLIEIGELSEEEANLILSSVTMNFLMEEDLEIVEEPSISLMGKLGDIQWKSLLPKVDYRICLESENLVAIQQASADILRSCNLEDLQSKFV